MNTCCPSTMVSGSVLVFEMINKQDRETCIFYETYVPVEVGRETMKVVSSYTDKFYEKGKY